LTHRGLLLSAWPATASAAARRATTTWPAISFRRGPSAITLPTKVPGSTLTLLTLLAALAKVPGSTLTLLTLLALRTIVTIKTIFTSVANIFVSVTTVFLAIANIFLSIKPVFYLVPLAAIVLGVDSILTTIANIFSSVADIFAAIADILSPITTIFLPISIGIPRRITLRAIQFSIAIGIIILQNTFFFFSFRSLLFFGPKLPITISVKFIKHFFSTRLLIPIFLLELLAGLPGGFFFRLIKGPITIGVKFFQDLRLAGSLSLLAIKLPIAIGVKFLKQPCSFGLPSVLGLGLGIFGPTRFDQTISQHTRC
jgi:hypothetical protein